ncbi:hypothetical protein N8H10_18010 [Curtobacterium flaccumfaciens pv. poinsettiae]|nr:hypothetical protein [Curtobacterium flaccumfaciens pv. poinsettiae]
MTATPTTFLIDGCGWKCCMTRSIKEMIEELITDPGRFEHDAIAAPALHYQYDEHARALLLCAGLPFAIQAHPTPLHYRYMAK